MFVHQLTRSMELGRLWDDVQFRHFQLQIKPSATVDTARMAYYCFIFICIMSWLLIWTNLLSMATSR